MLSRNRAIIHFRNVKSGVIMSIWKILGIEETKNKDELKKAYRTRLTGVNPEDDSEGFMQLRRAYEEAVRLADEQTASDSMVVENEDELISKLDAIYRDFDRRIDIDTWIELFNSDEFVSLETSEESFDTLMGHLMTHYHLPSKIYGLIVDNFDIKNRRKELAEKYPSDFMDYIISNATYDDLLDYYMLEGNPELFDEYIDKYYKLDLSYRKNDMDTVKIILDELSDMGVYHPYLDIIKIRFKLQSILEHIASDNNPNTKDTFSFDEEERLNVYELKGDAEILLEDFPDDITILCCIGDIDLLLEDYDEAAKIYERGLSLEPDNYLVKGKIAELAYRTGDYVKSRDLFMELLRINHYDNKVRAGMIRANQCIIDNNKKRLEEEPENNRIRLEIAWSCYQSYRFSEGIEILNSFEPEEKDCCEYYNVKGRTYLCMLDYDSALFCFFKWKKALEKLKDENEAESEEEKKDIHDKKKRYPYVNFLIADCYIKQKKYDSARAYLDISLSIPHDEQTLSLEAACELEFESGEYEKCLNACDRLISVDNRSYVAYIFKAKACMELNYLRDVLKSCEKAISIYPYTIEPYTMEIKVYHKVKQYADAKTVIERYRAILPDSETMGYLDGLTSRLEGKYREAADMLETLRKKHDRDNSDLESFDDVLMLLGDCYDNLNMDDEAIQCYKEVIGNNPKHKTANGDLAYMYKKKGMYHEALDAFTRQIKLLEHPVYYINRGILNKYFGNFKSALEDFREALRMDPHNAYCYSRIGIIYQMHREYKQAEINLDRALKDVGEDKTLETEVIRWKAINYACRGMYDDAVCILSELMDEGHTEDKYLCYDIAKYLLRAGRFEESKTLLQDYINNCEDKSAKLGYLRLLLQQLGEEGYIAEAVETFNVIISIDPNDYRAYGYMGRIFAQWERYKEAQEMFEKAVVIDNRKEENYYSELIEVIYKRSGWIKPNCAQYIRLAQIEQKDMNSPKEYIKMARLYRALKKYDIAIKYIDQAISNRRCDSCGFGGCEEAYYEKALIYEAMKQWDMARACLLKALQIHGHCEVYSRRLNELSKKLK